MTAGQVGRHHVVDEGKVPGLFTIPVDGRRLVLLKRADKKRDHGRVVRLGVLAGTEHVEIPEGIGFQTVQLPENPGVMLAGQL